MLRFVFLSLLLASASQVYSQANNKIADIDTLLNRYAKYGQLNGNLLIANDQEIIYQRSFGKANFELNVNNIKETKFRIASISKVLTAVMTFILAQEGKLNLEDRVSKYVPDFPSGDQISIEQLLSHRSGIIDHRNLGEKYHNVYGMARLSRTEMLNVFKDSALLFEPGAEWKYSNFGYNLLAVILEKISGMAYDELLKQKIFVPCGMLASVTLEHRELISQLSNCYEIGYDGLAPAQYYDGSMMVGAGSVITSASDLFLFFSHIKKGTLLNPKFQKRFYAISFIDENGTPAGYSTWFFKQPRHDRDSINIMFSVGNHFGTHALVYQPIGEDMLIVMLLNTKSPKLFEIADNILNIFYDIPYQLPRDSYVRWFSKDIRELGIKVAIDRFRQNKKIKGSAWTHLPRDLNRLGYHYMNQGKIQIAVEIFKLNLEYFPNESDFYDSLGEALAKLGDTKKAIENLKKSLDLNAKNDHAREILKSIEGN
jgi:CubicO group peptidase (beta-lactamase class C family)